LKCQQQFLGIYSDICHYFLFWNQGIFLKVFLLQLYCSFIEAFSFTIFKHKVFFIATLFQLYSSFVAALFRLLSFMIFKHKVFLSRLYCNFITTLLQHFHFWPQQTPFTYVPFYHSFIVTFILALLQLHPPYIFVLACSIVIAIFRNFIATFTAA
jgi:hypothetical protein